MKLQATVNTEIFANLVNVLSACGNEVVLHFSPTFISMCVPSGINQISLWISCNAQLCFSKYNIKSLRGDCVTLKCSSQQLNQALTLDSTPTINMMLTKSNDTTVLQFEHKNNDSTKQLIQNVFVTLLNAQAVENYVEPEWGIPSISVCFPPVKSLSTWVSEMKSINSLCCLSANKDGQVRVQVENESVTVETRYENLEVSSDPNAGSESDAEVLIEMKKLSKVLKVSPFQGLSGALYIYDRKMARISFKIPTSIADQPTTLTYVINATTKTS